MMNGSPFLFGEIFVMAKIRCLADFLPTIPDILPIFAFQNFIFFKTMNPIHHTSFLIHHSN